MRYAVLVLLVGCARSADPPPVVADSLYPTLDALSERAALVSDAEREGNAAAAAEKKKLLDADLVALKGRRVAWRLPIERIDQVGVTFQSVIRKRAQLRVMHIVPVAKDYLEWWLPAPQGDWVARLKRGDRIEIEATVVGVKYVPNAVEVAAGDPPIAGFTVTLDNVGYRP